MKYIVWLLVCGHTRRWPRREALLGDRELLKGDAVKCYTCPAHQRHGVRIAADSRLSRRLPDEET